MRTLVATLTLSAAMGILALQACVKPPSSVGGDPALLVQRAGEAGPSQSGIFDIAVPPAGTVLRPVQRVPRNQFGVVGAFPLQQRDLPALIYPDATTSEQQAVLEGMRFFTTPHTAAEGLGPLNNQLFCLGCHMSTAEAVQSPGLLSPGSCTPGSTCVSNVSRAARSTPTNFAFTSLDPATGGGRPADNLDAIHNTGQTAAFTLFGDFDPSASSTNSIGFFDPLDGTTRNIVTGGLSQPFGGMVQHTRPAVAACVPKPIPPVEFDTNLKPTGSADPTTGLYPTGFRRSVGELAGPPYIGRGLIEAVPTQDILANADPDDTQGHRSSLGNYAAELGCKTDCISGRVNMIPRTVVVDKDADGNVTSVTGFVGGVGRFGLRANGVELLQFIIGGLQGELSFTTIINDNEINFPTLFPHSGPTVEPAACMKARSSSPEVSLSTPFSIRNFLRNTAPPEFGDALLDVLNSPDPTKPLDKTGDAAKVARGAALFGIDLKAFADRTVAGRMPAAGDGLDPNAIDQADRKLNCVGCHTPIQRTGRSPAEVGAEHLSFVWAPIFSDLLLHSMPVIDAERLAQTPRDPLVIARPTGGRAGETTARIVDTFDLPRNFAQDTFANQKASADGREFRTAPLMGLGRIGPPFLHDARVYLSELTVESAAAGTVTTNRRLTNAPLVVRSLDDALLAAIELHDLPAPDDGKAPRVPGAGCPAPPTATNVSYGPSPQAVICPPYNGATSRTNRSEAREVIRRFRELSTEDQQAVIAFLKQL